MSNSSVREVIAARSETYLSWLRDLCAIPSVSAQGRDIDVGVNAVRTLVEQLGGTVRILELPGANPAVYAEFRGETDRTLLFYNHYDVQPPEPLGEWERPPFAGVVEDGCFYARGAADNKGDLISRLAAVDAWQRAHGKLPIHVKFLIEGEEEIGSPNLEAYVQQYSDLLSCDACIWQMGSRDPAGRLEMSLGLKGIAYVELSVDIAKSDLHSGYGAVVEAASNRLVRALATLRDGRGQVLIAGFYDDVRPPSPHVRASLEAIPFEDQELREMYGIERFIRDRTRTGALATLILEPTCTFCGIESGYTGPGVKTVLPRRATAKLDFRLVPDQTPERVVDRLRRHLKMKGFEDIEVKLLIAEHPHQTPFDHPFVERARLVAERSTGRTVVTYPNAPFSGPMYPVAQKLQVPIVSLGVGYWNRRTHAPNEHICLDDFYETIALFSELFVAEGDAGRKGG